MKTENNSGKKPVVVYRKDGQTPDLRYKSSRDFVSLQLLEINKNKMKDTQMPDMSYAGFRDHAFSQQSGNPGNIPPQIKPSGKKPLWKVTGSN